MVSSSSSPLMSSLQGLTSAFTQNPISASDCVVRLDAVIEAVKGLNPRRFAKDDVAAHAEEALRFLFASRVDLHEQMKSLSANRQLSETCAIRIRRAFRHLRGVEDFVGSIGYADAQGTGAPFLIRPERRYDPNAVRLDNLRVYQPHFFPAPIVQFPKSGTVAPPSYLPPSTLVNPRLTSAHEVRSGDVLLSRGNANTSALIARMGDEDTQFSHLAMVYVDPRSKKAYTIEAHIEFGSVIAPMEEWLADGKARTLVFRHADADLAHRAAAHIYQRVKKRFDADNRIKYDFAFNMHDHERLFCSEVAREGFEVASRGTVMVPAFASHLTMKNRDLMERLGISEVQSFIPADMEIDPRFTMIAEWRDFAKLPTVWKKDAILTSIYAWMENEGYEFDSNAWLQVKGGLARALRNLGFIEDRMPTYMTQDTIVLNFMLDDVVEELESILAEKEKTHRRATGYGLSYYEFLKELDAIQRSQGRSASGPFRFLHKP